MNLLEYIIKTPIPKHCGETYSGMAFDGCNYYLLLPCMCRIIKINLQCKGTTVISTEREYSCICYDYEECCFWAASRDCFSRIYKLNCNFEEIDCIVVRGCSEWSGVITGIAYDCRADTLLVALGGSVVEVDKETEQVWMKHKAPSLWITGICCVSPYYIITAIKDCKQYIMKFDRNNQLLETCLVPCEYIVKGIVFNPCGEECGGYVFDILVNKSGNYPYMIKVKMEKEKFGCRPFPCNYSICKSCCGDHPHKPCDPCTDVIESSALVETAIAHILNAEGEKIQKILATTDDFNEILCINKEVNKTIINATHLEHILYAKLVAITEYCDCEDSCGDGSCCEK